MANSSVVRRSWLVIPGCERTPLDYVRKYLPDVLVLDLEYTVPPKRKKEARAALGNTVRGLAQYPSEIFVRVDWKTRWCDVKAAMYPGLRGIVLPGPELEKDVTEIDEFIGACEQERGVVPGTVELALILESARGFQNALSLAKASPRITALGVGRVDLTMNLEPDPEGDFHIYPYLMSRVLTIARASGKQPLGAHWRQGSRGGVDSPEHTLEAARGARRMGFSGCLCAKPEQVAPASGGFTPTKDEVNKLTQILEKFEKAQNTGQTYADIGGCLYDAAKAQACRFLLTFARDCAKKDSDKALWMKAEAKQ